FRAPSGWERHRATARRSCATTPTAEARKRTGHWQQRSMGSRRWRQACATTAPRSLGWPGREEHGGRAPQRIRQRARCPARRRPRHGHAGGRARGEWGSRPRRCARGRARPDRAESAPAAAPAGAGTARGTGGFDSRARCAPATGGDAAGRHGGRCALPAHRWGLALVENVQRADLNPLEEAAAYQQLVEEFGLTQEEIGRRVGKSRFAIANTLRLLTASAAVQQAVLDGELTEGHARAILGLRDKEAQRRVVAQVIEHGLSVRATEELVRRLQEPVSPPVQRRAGRARRPPELEELEERLRAALGTKVSLTRSRRGGRLSIFFYDDEQLQSLLDRLVGV